MTATRTPRAVLAVLALVALLGGLLMALPATAHADLAASDTFDGWTTTVSGSPDFVIAADTATGHEGATSARVDFDSLYSTSYVDLRQSVRANGGVTYDMSVWVRTENLSSAGAAYVVLSSDHSERVELPAGTNGWTRLAWSYTQPAGSMSFVMRFLVRGAGTVWLDDVHVAVAGDDQNLVVNPSFEEHEPPPGALAFSDPALVYSSGDAHVGVTTTGQTVAWDLRASSGQRLDTGRVTVTDGGASIDLSALPAGYYELTLGVDAPSPTTRTATLAILDAPAAAVPTADRQVGLAVHVNRYSVEQVDALMAPLGAGTMREGPSWDTVETSPGVYEFPALFDAQVAAAKSRGERPLVILAYASRWYDDGTTPSSPEGIAAFARYAAAAAAHYGSDVDYEIYNEFNDSFNTGACGTTAACYLALLAPTADAVHHAAPGARVVGPVLAGARWDFMEDLFALGGLDYLDAVSYHTYDFPVAPEGRAEAGVATLRRLVDQYAPPGVHLPIWLTEHGWTTTTGGTTEQQQAAFVVRSAALLEAAGVERVVFYELIDSGVNPAETEHNFGLVRRPADGGTALTPKPAYPALAVFDRLTARRTLAQLRRLDGAITADYVDAAGQVVRMVWATDAPVTVAVETGASARVVRGDGRSWRARPNSRVELTVDADPVFVSGAVGTPAVVAAPAVHVGLPEEVPLDTGVDAPVTVERGALDMTGDVSVVGPVGAGTTLTGTGDVAEGALPLEPLRELGTHPVTTTVRSADAVVAYVAGSVDVVENPVLAFGPGQDADGTVRPSLRAANVGADPVDVDDISWTLGDRSGTLPALAVAPGAMASFAIEAPLDTWQPYPFTVTAAAGGEQRRLVGTTALAPVADDPANAVTVDWKARGTYVALSGGVPDDDDLSGTFALSWSEEGLRLHAAVRDTDHRPAATADRLWDGDSIQFAVGRGLPGQDPGSRVELGIHPDLAAPSVYRYTAPVGPEVDATTQVARADGTTTYDVVVPWDVLGIDPADGAFSFSILVNDDDGGTREGFLQWGGGIGASKDAALFLPVVPVGAPSHDVPCAAPGATPPAPTNLPAPALRCSHRWHDVPVAPRGL
ncbi:hypothetical protein [Luteimicrobium sp. DT211]|uniref:hypothetical protein n=1 Tax=Luteimicrobium sp. DT211 TaxID=3393412 RepID=UPI003CF5AE58